MGQEAKKYTIGLLAGGIMDNFTESVAKGVMHGLKKEARLVLIPGGYLDRDLSTRREILYEYQYNTLFSYATKETVDALIISAGSLGCFATEARIREFLEYYAGIPTVLVASKMDGYISVNYDNYQGIRDGMEYLMRERGCSRFCMVGGPENNVDARERKAAFVKTLEDNGLSFADKNYVEGDFSRNTNEQFAKLLEDNPGVEAVFCVNDLTALGFYDELKKRGLEPGRDVYILGYDNTMLGAKAQPSLSTVWADSVRLGEHAAYMVLRMLRGESVESEVIPTKLVRRNSFGEPGGEGADSSHSLLNPESVKLHFNDIFYRATQGVENDTIRELRTLFEKMIFGMEQQLTAGQCDKGQKEEIVEAADAFIHAGALDYADVDSLMQYLNQVYREIKNRKAGTGCELLETFEAIYRKIIFSLNHRFGDLRRQTEDSWFSMKTFVRDILQFEKGNDQSYEVLVGNLDWLDVKRAGVYIFKSPITHLDGEFFAPPKDMYLKVLLADGSTQTLPSTSQKRGLGEIFDIGETPDGPCYMVMLPLFFNEILYGIVVCDLTERLFFEGEFLTNQMSAAAKMIGLLNSNESIQQLLEGSLIAMKQNNIVLDKISKNDALTGIHNRRGFFEEAEKFVAKKRSEEKSIVVAYVDMDNLKIINDRYGHEEGDCSLKLIGDTLAGIVGARGVIGRIGGDEFNLVMELEEGKTEAELVRELKESFDGYNESSLKEYNVTASVGTYTIDDNNGCSLKEALALADEKLYEAKKLRIKQVAKEKNIIGSGNGRMGKENGDAKEDSAVGGTAG